MRNCQRTPQRRRGTRVRAQIPVRLTSLDPATKFSENCHTLVVNPQGCGVRFSHPLEPGMQVRVDDLPGGGSATAHVASSIQANIGLSAYALSNRLTGGISLLLRKIGTSILRFPDSFLLRSGTLTGKPSRRSHPAALSNACFTFA